MPKSAELITARAAIGSVPVASNDAEIPTDESFRDRMRAARKAAGMTQRDLGAAVGATQAAISLIESGGSGSSSLVLRICRKLEIPPPLVLDDALERRWLEAGRALRSRRPNLFESQLAFVESAVAEFSQQEQTEDGKQH